MPTFDQIRAPSERVILLALAYAAGRGWIAAEEVAGLGVLLLGILSAFYGWYTTRPVVIAQRAAEALPAGTKIVTSSEIADATPGNSNIVSNQDVKVVKQ